MRAIWLLGAVAALCWAASLAVGQETATTDEATAHFGRGQEAFQQADYETARTEFQAALELSPNNATYLIWLGTTCLQIAGEATAAGNAEAAAAATEEARQHLEEAVRLSPAEGLAWNNLGKAYYDLGDLTNAERCLKEAINTEPLPGRSRAYIADAHRNLGLVYDHREQWAAAVEHFRAAIAENDDDANAWFFLGRAYRHADSPEQAEPAFARYVELAPQDLEAWLELGEVRLELGQDQPAAEAFNQAYHLDQNSGEALLGLGTAWYHVRSDAGERPEEAEPCLRKATQLLPDSYAAWYNLGLTLKELGSYQEALASFERADELAPEKAAVYNQQGYCHYILGRDDPRQYAEAARAFRQATELEPQFYEPWPNLALALDKQGEFEQEHQVWQDIIARFPQRATAHLGCGNFLFDRRDQQETYLAQAMVEYQRAIESDDTLVEAYNNLGLVFLEKGQPVEAQVRFRQALHIDPDYVYALNNLGVAHELLGELDEACRRYQQALNVDPNFELARQNFDRLNCAQRLGGQ